MRAHRVARSVLVAVLAISCVAAWAPSSSAVSPGWDETGFSTAGGYAPFGSEGWCGCGPDASVVQLADGSLLLTYVGKDKRTRWERYTSAGALVKAPSLGVGVLERPMGEKLVVGNHDAAAVPGGVVIAQDVVGVAGSEGTGNPTGSKWGVVVAAYDASMQSTGAPFVLQGHHSVALAASADRVWAVTGKDWRLFVTEFRITDGQVWFQRQYPVTEVPSGWRVGYADLALDGTRLVVGYERSSGSGPTPTLAIRAAIVDTASGQVQRDVLVVDGLLGSDHNGGGNTQVSMGTAGGKAYAEWTDTQNLHLRVAAIDLGSGGVTQLPDVASVPPTSPFHAVNPEHATELATVGGALRLLAIDDAAVTIDKIKRARFKLWPLANGQLQASPLMLDGGFPLRADVLVELDTFAQNPRKAIVTHRTILEGSLLNRGTQTAKSVKVTVTVDGSAVATLSIGSVAPGKRIHFATDWTPPLALANESVPVRYTVTTTSAEYTTGNNAATFTAFVRQKGVVYGYVADTSADITGKSDWHPGLAGASVTIGGGQPAKTTDANGFFTYEELPFGAYAVAATKAGYKPTSPKSLTLSRDKPIARVSLSTDNHGVLRLKVVDQAGKALSGADVYLVGTDLKDRTGSNGTLVYDLPTGTYSFAVVKHGYWSVPDQEFSVVVSQDVTRTISLEKATKASISGLVVDRHGVPISDATVTITKSTGGPALATLAVDAEGRFGPAEVPADPSATYNIVATSPSHAGLSGTASPKVYGGDEDSEYLVIAPGVTSSDSLKGVSATEGYTTWMVKASWPGFLDWPSAAMYVWSGNYSIKISTEYWGDTHEISGVDVAVQGGTYESHATTSEVDFTNMNKDYKELFEVTKFSGKDASLGSFAVSFVTDHWQDVIDIAGSVKDLVTGESANDAVITGQGPALLTWKEAKEDFRVIPEFDSSNPLESIFDIVTSIPLGFAIPVVIGGSSVEKASVRVDQVDIVDVTTRETLWSSSGTWFSWQGPNGAADHANQRHYNVTTPGLDARNVAVYVWLRVGKIRDSDVAGGTVHQTSFEQRAEQVVIFRPANKAMAAYIAPGDIYRDSLQVRYQ